MTENLLPTGLPDPASARPATWRARILFAAKIAVTLGVLGILLAQADWGRLAGRLADVSVGLLVLGFLVKALTIPFAAERWRMIGRTVGMHLAPGLSLRLVMAALFFGQVLPGALGGDIVRGWLTWRSGQLPGTVVTALVLDRLAALAGVVMLILVGLPHLLTVVPPAMTGTVLGAAALVALGLLVLLRIDRLPVPARWRHRLLERAFALVARFRTALTHRAAAVALAHSIAVHLSTIGATLVFAQALSVPIRPLDALAVMPLTIAAMALPISLAGWGVREGSMVAGFALFGVAGEDALLVSILIGLSVTLMALPGGLAWLSLRAAAPSVIPSTQR